MMTESNKEDIIYVENCTVNTLRPLIKPPIKKTINIKIKEDKKETKTFNYIDYFISFRSYTSVK